MLNFSYLFDQTFRITSTNRLSIHTENTSFTKPHLPQLSRDLIDCAFDEPDCANFMKMMDFPENVELFWKCFMTWPQWILYQKLTKTQTLQKISQSENPLATFLFFRKRVSLKSTLYSYFPKYYSFRKQKLCFWFPSDSKNRFVFFGFVVFPFHFCLKMRRK